jgi:hypothetical protein
VNPHELEQLRDASGLLNKLLSRLNGYLNRTYPRVSRHGSQHNEDQLLAELLPGDGTYVDFGAGEPEECSNTWAFYQRGWRGLLVEPCRLFHDALLHQRPGDFIYNSAVRSYTGQTVLRLRGTVTSVLEDWLDVGEQLPTHWVPCETAADILAKFPQVRDACRLCSIDVEGVEKEVLESIDWTTFRPDVFCIEYRKYDPVKLGEDISGEWTPLLEKQGYREVARTSLNLIFQDEALIPEEPESVESVNETEVESEDIE